MSDGDDFNAQNIAEFRANHGRVGGQFEGAPILILHTSGAHSGEPRTNIMMYLKDGDRYLVFASKAGAETNPARYFNMRAHERVRVEIGDEAFDADVTELDGARHLWTSRTPSVRRPHSMTNASPGGSRASPRWARTRSCGPVTVTGCSGWVGCTGRGATPPTRWPPP